MSLLDQQLESIFGEKGKKPDLCTNLYEFLLSVGVIEAPESVEDSWEFYLASDTGSSCPHVGLHVFLFIHKIQKGLCRVQYLACILQWHHLEQHSLCVCYPSNSQIPRHFESRFSVQLLMKHRQFHNSHLKHLESQKYHQLSLVLTFLANWVFLNYQKGSPGWFSWNVDFLYFGDKNNCKIKILHGVLFLFKAISMMFKILDYDLLSKFWVHFYSTDWWYYP